MIINMTVFRCRVRRLELYSFRRPGVVSGQHSLILFESEYGYTVLGCFALHLKDIVIFQEILKNCQKEGVTLPKFLENLRAFFREVDEALINF